MFLILFACLWAFANCQYNFDGPALYDVADVNLSRGGSPSWDPRKNVLFFTDSRNAKVFSYNYKTKALNSINVPGRSATPIALTKSPKVIIVGVNSSIMAIEWDGASSSATKQKILATLKPKYELPEIAVLIDGKVDKNGNLWLTSAVRNVRSNNTINGGFLPKGALYRVTKNNVANPEVKLTNLTLTNGMSWNLANDKFYYTDVFARQVVQYDFDLKSGAISNRKVAFNAADHPDLPNYINGIITDNDDNLWISLYGGGSIIKVNPKTNEVLQRIAIPAKHVGSFAWGGPKSDVLFVASANTLLTPAEKLFYPGAGDVFALTNLPTTGMREYYTNIVGSNF